MEKLPKKNKILIVDDDTMNLNLLEAFLTAANENYELISAANGSQALEKVAKYNPDLVLLDIMMPEINGFDVCSIIKNNPATRFLPVILITALNDRENKIKGIEVGADDFLAKPVDRIELITRVKSLLLTKSLHDDLENHYKLLKKELAMAKYLQESLLPKSVPDMASLDIAVFYQPSIEIGGDFYYFMDIDEHNLG
ncbi:MAG: response regulator, partial [Clostridia bacterium]|nr:response regulator [Clostridia bacterium]